MYSHRLRRTALIIAILSSFMTPFMGSSINLAFPAIAKEFKIDAVILTWIPTPYLLASAVCLVPFGRLADLFYGRKKVFAFGAVRTMRLLGMMIGMGTATVVFALFIGRVEISEVTYPALVKSIGILFLFFSILCFDGILASMVRGKAHLP